LKGSARLAGAMRLGEMAHRMETAVEQIGTNGVTNNATLRFNRSNAVTVANAIGVRVPEWPMTPRNILNALATGQITGAAGDTFTAGRLGEYTVEENDTLGRNVLLGPPFIYHALQQHKPDAWIAVDGGVSPQTAPAITAAGASVLVAGNAIFSASSELYPQMIRTIREAALSSRT